MGQISGLSQNFSKIMSGILDPRIPTVWNSNLKVTQWGIFSNSSGAWKTLQTDDLIARATMIGYLSVSTQCKIIKSNISPFLSTPYERSEPLFVKISNQYFFLEYYNIIIAVMYFYNLSEDNISPRYFSCFSVYIFLP